MKKKSVLWGCIALVVVLVVVIGIILATGNKGKDENPESTPAVTDESGQNGSVSDETGSDLQDETGESVAAEEPDFSSGLLDSGFFDGITAADYVTLCEYKGVKIPAEEAAVSDEEFEEYVENNILASYGEKVEITDRAVENGDTVNIDYVGSIDGVEFDGGSAQGYSLVIGSHSFIDDFEDQIIGHEIGDTFEVNATFPDPYKNNPDLAGKEAVFKVTLNGITATEIPELDDAFVAEKFSDYGSAEEFLKEVREDYTENKKNNYVWNYVLENSTVSEIPEQLIENYVEQQTKMYQYMAASYGMSYEDLLSYYGTTPEEFEASEREYANSDLTKMLISQAVCEAEGIAVEEGDDTKYFGYDADAMADIYDNYGKGYVNQILLMQKASEFAGNNSVIEE